MRSDAITEVERPWVHAVRERGVEAVREELLARGLPVTKAGSIAWWLADQAAGIRRTTAPATSGYRRELSRLGFPQRRTLGIPG